MPSATALRVALLLAASASFSAPQSFAAAPSQNAAPRPRITAPIIDTERALIPGNVRPGLENREDLGIVPDSQPLHHLTMVLQRSPERQAALDGFIAKANTPGTPEFHRWLTPQQFGEQFGVSRVDLERVGDWLRTQGFTVTNVPNNAQFVIFAGTAGQVRQSFHTELHSFRVDGQVRFANVSAPQVPAAFAGVVVGVKGLSNFPLRPQHTTPRKVTRDQKTGRWHIVGETAAAKPADTSGGEYDEAPGDFTKIYNVGPVYSGGTVGAGATVAVAEESDIAYGTVNSKTGAATGGDVAAFRSVFGVNAVSATLNMVVYHGYGSDTCSDPGVDPSGIDEDVEASLDAEWATATAPGAKLIFMSCDDTADDGVQTSLQALIDNNLADVISLSYGASEQDFASTDYTFFDALWQEAAAQGQSLVFSTGDAGSDVNDQEDGSNYATSGLNVSGLSASPLVTAAGGTDFQDQYDQIQGGVNQSTYWSSTNSSTYESALKYIPETAWDSGCSDSLIAVVDGYTNIATACGEGAGGDISGGSGGVSTNYALPAYQSGITGLSSSFTMRVQPDVSLFASNGVWGHGVLYCDSRTGSSCTGTSFGEAGGTSFVAPQLAGLGALLVSYTGERQGVLNYGLYSLARQQFTASATKAACYSNGQTANTGVTTGAPAASCSFNDITTGDNDVQCKAGTPGCYVISGATYGVLSTAGAKSLTIGYPSGAGYDAATGLGSLNVANLFANWSKASGSATALTASASTITTAGSVTLTPSVSQSNGVTSTGTVTFLSGTVTIGTCTLNSGTCSFTVTGTALGMGQHSITAVYGGSKTFSGSTSAAVSVDVTATTVSTTTAVSVSPANSASLGSNVTVTAIVTAASGNPAGTVTFNVYSSGQLVLTSGALTVSAAGGSSTQSKAIFGPLSTYGQPAGTYTVAAVYAPTGSFAGSTSATSSYTLTKATPSATLTPASQTVTRPGNISLTATVSGLDGTPGGTVTFSIPGMSLGTYTLSQKSAGTAQFVAVVGSGNYPAGTYTVTATYSGSGNYLSASATAMVTIK